MGNTSQAAPPVEDSTRGEEHVAVDTSLTKREEDSGLTVRSAAEQAGLSMVQQNQETTLGDSTSGTVEDAEVRSA